MNKYLKGDNMRQSQKILEASDIYSYRRYFQQIFVVLGVLLLSVVGSSAFAAVTCDAGFIADNFSNADYGKLASNSPPPTTGADKLLDGIAGENYVFAANSFTTNGALDSGGINTYKSITTGGVQNFEFFQDFSTPETTRTVSYTFKNKFTNNSQALDKLSLTVYDIDSNVSLNPTIFRPRYFEFFDEVTITGFTSSGSSISPILSSKGTTITDNAPYRQQSTNSDFSCSGLDNRCKVSVAFDEPIVRVDIVYGNNTDLNYYYNRNYNNPGDQLINIVFDGYCYKPQPRLTYNKELSDSRKANTDQFTVQIKDNADNSVVTSNITTTTTKGAGSTITTGTGTTGIFKIDPTKTYTLTETSSGTTTLSNYMPAYTCRKSGPNGAIITTLNPNSLQLTYGDDWTCTVTNSLKSYTFTGYVFNDNGGIANTDPQNISSFTNVNNYFNGSFESSTESGIFNTNLKVRLTDCGANGGTNIAGTSAQSVSSNVPATRGQYKFSVPASALANRPNVCLVQVEPNPWNDYSVDTTPNEYKIMLKSGVFDYKTGVQDAANNILNLDFGEVTQNQSALVLKKYQYVHDCDANLNYRDASLNRVDIAEPTDGFSINAADKIEPGRCIAYKIEAYNRGHIALTSIQITDNLQERTTTQPESMFALPTAKLIINNNETNLASLNRKIVSPLFDLPNTSTTTAPVILYFNTKYGTTSSPNP